MCASELAYRRVVSVLCDTEHLGRVFGEVLAVNRSSLTSYQHLGQLRRELSVVSRLVLYNASLKVLRAELQHAIELE